VKLCGRCGLAKPDPSFHRSTRRGLQAWCKDCRKEYDAAYHRRHRERRRLQKKQNRADFMGWYHALKEGKPCTDCGAVLPPRAMQWDHLPGNEKIDHVATLRQANNRRRILAEIAKCELVCANCHAVRTLARHGA
jgi:hypothetical protein